MRRSLILFLMAGSLLLAACGTSGGDEASSSDGDGTDVTATTAADPTGDATSTTEAGTDDSDDDDSPVTSADLEAILPTAAEIGPDYTLDDSDDADGEGEDDDTSAEDPDAEDPTEAAMEEQCPKAAELDFLEDTDGQEDEVSAEFVTELDQGIEVTLDPDVETFTKENVAKVIEAYNECGTISVDDPEAGSMTMELSAEALEGYGDYGAHVTMQATFELFGRTVPIEFQGYLFVVDDVAVGVTASSGLDETNFEPTPGDVDLLPGLAAEMETRVESL